MPSVHATAIVAPEAELGSGVEVGPYCVVEGPVRLGDGVRIGPHSHVAGHTRIGAGTRIHPFASVGGVPQDLKFAGETSYLEIGTETEIREHVTIHVGTAKGGGTTRVGDRNLIMNGVHVAHDCQLGSDLIIGSYSGLAGHVEIDDYAVLGAYTGVHQYSRIGESVMTAANTMLSQDAPPFALVAGDRARLAGVNAVGLKRRGMAPAVRAAIKHAFHLIFHSKLTLAAATERLRAEGEPSPEVARLLRFLEVSERGFVR